MADPFVDTLNGYKNLAARIKNEDPSLLLETNNTADTPKDVNKNGLMNKQAKQFANVSKYYDRSQLEALSLAASYAEIGASRDKPFKGPDDFTKITGDFDLVNREETPNAFTGRATVSGERNKIHASIHGELSQKIALDRSEKVSGSASLFGSKSKTKTKYPDGVVVDEIGREVGAVIKGAVVLNDKAVIYASASGGVRKNKTKVSTFESKNYGKLSVIEIGAVFGGLEANLKKTIENGNKYTTGEMSYKWDGQSLSARTDTQGNFGIDYEIKF
tara:strand:+ start:57 stop:878 length:822 start_codon:yes stop_codon:yes gene_type:complete